MICRISCLVPALSILLPLLPADVLAWEAEAVDIGTRLELFIDDFLIDRMTGLELELHHPVPQGVVLRHDRPWEGSGCGYHQIFRDGDLFRLYYRGWQPSKGWPMPLTAEDTERILPHGLVGCYAESRDGIHWEKPELGLFEFQGSKRNNIIWDGHEGHDLTPFRDANPAALPEARYKAVAFSRTALRAFQSPDGIHWSLMNGGKPVMTQGAFDTQNIAFWDSIRREYRAYIRDFHPARNGKKRIRDIRTATSQDFINWSEPVILKFPGAPEEQLYTNQIAPYYRAPHIFIGFPVRYQERAWDEHSKHLPQYEHRKRRSKVNQRYASAVTDTLFMSSRDGLSFRRWGEAFLRPGIQHPNNWSYGDIYVAWHAVETSSPIRGAPNEISLYASESYWTGQTNRLRRYTLRVDGFVSVNAPLKGGELLTRPLVFSGNTLEINFSTSAAGSIEVEIQDPSGRPLPGFSLEDSYEMFGDQLDRPVEWRSGKRLGSLAGRPVRLRFVMRDADLYSVRFLEGG